MPNTRTHVRNVHRQTVASFGDEWSRFDQFEISDDELMSLFDGYFSIFPWTSLPPNSEGFDMGCGSGRWARYLAPKVGRLHCIEPSAAILVAKRKLEGLGNVSFHQASVCDSGLPSASQDFGVSLGVLHHVPDTESAVRSCAELLKPGAPLLLYLYYDFDNRPCWFRMLWRLSDVVRRIIYHLPPMAKNFVTDIIAVVVYWPLARLSSLFSILGLPIHSIPLSFYRHHSLYTMRTDSRDRFGTPLEKRFSRDQIEQMMLNAGLTKVRFSENAPYWCAVGFKV